MRLVNFGSMSCDYSAKVKYQLEDMLACHREIVQMYMQAGSAMIPQNADHLKNEQNFRQVLPCFSMSSRARVHTTHIQLLFGVVWKVKTIENLR
jgi:hypothetical protein